MPCTKFDHPNLQPGWGCCQCNTFNGDQRLRCKHCEHEPCHEGARVADLSSVVTAPKGKN